MQETLHGTRPSGSVAIDPITLEVIRHRLVSITNQIDANIKRTAFSPYIYEYNDFAVGLVGSEGQLIAQCTGGMPPFVADSVGMAVRDGLSIYGKARLHHGDVVLCNHAAVQGQHLNNTVMYTPIYAGAARDQAVVEGRAGRGGLPDHREQYADAARTDGRHRGAARRLRARSRSDSSVCEQIRHCHLRPRGRSDPRPIG